MKEVQALMQDRTIEAVAVCNKGCVQYLAGGVKRLWLKAYMADVPLCH
jgi:hypothetical protein